MNAKEITQRLKYIGEQANEHAGASVDVRLGIADLISDLDRADDPPPEPERRITIVRIRPGEWTAHIAGFGTYTRTLPHYPAGTLLNMLDGEMRRIDGIAQPAAPRPEDLARVGHKAEPAAPSRMDRETAEVLDCLNEWKAGHCVPPLVTQGSHVGRAADLILRLSSALAETEKLNEALRLDLAGWKARAEQNERDLDDLREKAEARPPLDRETADVLADLRKWQEAQASDQGHARVGRAIACLERVAVERVKAESLAEDRADVMHLLSEKLRDIGDVCLDAGIDAEGNYFVDGVKALARQLDATNATNKALAQTCDELKARLKRAEHDARPHPAPPHPAPITGDHGHPRGPLVHAGCLPDRIAFERDGKRVEYEATAVEVGAREDEATFRVGHLADVLEDVLKRLDRIEALDSKVPPVYRQEIDRLDGRIRELAGRLKMTEETVASMVRHHQDCFKNTADRIDRLDLYAESCQVLKRRVDALESAPCSP